MKNYRIEIKWAAVFVLMTLSWIAIEKLTGMYTTNIDKHPIVTNIIAIPAITVYVLALLDKRRNYYYGAMTYKQGFVTGLVITAFVTAFSPVTQLLVNVIAPEYFPNMIAYTVAQGKMTPEAAEANFNLKSYIIQALIGTPIMGLITTTMVALFTRKKAERDLAVAGR